MSTKNKPTGAFARMPAIALMEGYQNGDFSPSEVVDDVICALEATDAVCGVIVTEMFEQARAEAARATAAWARGENAGALQGVPVTVKDLVYVAGVPALGGSPMNNGHVPSEDSAVVQALRRAGAVMTCKTTTCESGYKLTADSPVSGITRNPWRLDRTSGGSSGGAAAAVAAGCGPLAIGTDAVGSIRVPSSFCGVFGIKPTFGLVPRAPGFFPPSWGSLAHTGPIGRTVGDTALLLSVIEGYDRRDAVSLPVQPRLHMLAGDGIAGMRIAYTADFGWAALDPDVRAAFEASLAALEELGAELVEADLAVPEDALTGILKPIGYTEQSTAAMTRSEEELGLSEPDFADVVRKGQVYSGRDYMAATHRRAQLRGSFVKLFDDVAALVTPTVATTAFAAGTLGVDEIDGRTVDRHLGWSPFSWPINLAGLPAATVPNGFDRDGLPIGLQIVAPWLDETTIFRVAASMEILRPWADHWPTLGAGDADTAPPLAASEQ